MEKIKCPQCKQIVMETDGMRIRVRLPRKDDTIVIPFAQGPFIHGQCKGMFFIHNLTAVIKTDILVLNTTKETQVSP